MQLIYDNGYMKSEYDPLNKVVITHTTGLVNIDKIKDGFTQTMKFMETHPTEAVLYNAEHMKGTFTDLNKFISEEVSPFYDKIGVKYAISALSMDVFSRFAVNQLLKLLKTKRDVKIVKTFAEAKTYLEDKMSIEIDVKE